MNLDVAGAHNCPDCGWEIDPDTCFCGDPKHSHDPSHTFVPMGCVCQDPKHTGDV